MVQKGRRHQSLGDTFDDATSLACIMSVCRFGASVAQMIKSFKAIKRLQAQRCEMLDHTSFTLGFDGLVFLSRLHRHLWTIGYGLAFPSSL